MFGQSFARAFTMIALLGAPLIAGDYDHLFDVVREAWPERTVAMVLCDKDASQMELIDLAETAKVRNISLVVIDLRDEKDYNRTMASAMARNPAFIIIIEGDALLGAKGKLTTRMIYRAASREVPAAGLSKGLLELGAVLAAGPDPKDPVYCSKEVAERMKLPVPAGAVDPSVKKKGK